MIASQNDHLEVVRALLAAEADTNAKMTDNVTALIYASQNGHLEVVRALLAAHADVSAQAANDRTALIQASQNGHLEVVRALLAAQADVNAQAVNGRTALIQASQDDHLEVVRTLLAAGADVNAKMANGGTALMIASQNGHLDMVQALLAARADVNAKMTNGGTALFAASYNGHVDVVRALLAANADVNAKTANGATAWTAASAQRRVDVVQALLAANADVTAKNGQRSHREKIYAQNDHPRVVPPPSDRTPKEEGSGAQSSIPAWIVRSGKIYAASQITNDIDPPEVDKSTFTWKMVHPLKKGSLAFMERGEKGQNVAWSVSTYSFDVGQNRVSYPIEAIVPPCSGGWCHLMLLGIFKAKIDIKAGDTLRMDGYQIRAGRTVRAGDTIPVLSWGYTEYLSIEAANDGEPWLTAFRDETNPSDRASTLEAWRTENERVAEWIRVLESATAPKPISVPEPVKVPRRAYCSASYTINLTV